MLGQFLSELGVEFVEAGNGQEGLEQLKKMPKPDLMLVDWNMPVMNGIDFVRAVREQSEFDDSLLMMITTETDVARMCDALDAGANEYLMKPFTKEALGDKIELLKRAS